MVTHFFNNTPPFIIPTNIIITETNKQKVLVESDFSRLSKAITESLGLRGTLKII